MVHGVPLDAPPLELAYGRPMSIEEWEQMEEDAPGELVDGRLEEDALWRELDEEIDAEAPSNRG